MESLLKQLRERLGEVADVRSAIALLEWDQETYMPPKAHAARGQQLATLAALAHRLFTSEAMGALLDNLSGGADALSYDDRRLVEETRYDFDRATRLPEAFVQQFAEEQSKAYHAWVQARAESNFSLFEPNLQRIVDLLRQKADLFGYEESPYDALLEEFERGMTASALDGVFGVLASRQSDLVKRIAASGKQPDLGWLDQPWHEARQWAFTMRVLGDMGFDLDAGRQDRSIHPFTTSMAIQDVRVTTRTNTGNLFSSILASLHEGGHALYEQGFREEDARTTLAHEPSLGMHESQSRLWENLVGRSLPFWRHYMPVLRQCFPSQLDSVSAEQVYAAVNLVEPSLIRVEADECTYNLHIVLRFDIERALIEGRLAVRDVPKAWNAKVREYLGIEVPDDAQGCLQDIHWSHGAFGYFPTYALGNLYASQIFETIETEISDLWDQIGSGDFSALRAWLRERIHQYGRRKLAREFVQDISGSSPSPEPFLAHLERKFGRLYGT